MKLYSPIACIVIACTVLAGCAQESGEGTTGDGTASDPTGEIAAEIFEGIPEQDESVSGLGALLEFLASGDAAGIDSISRDQLDVWGIPNAGELTLEDPWDSYPVSPFIPVLLPEDFEGDVREIEDMLASLTYQDFRDDPTGFYESIGLDLTSDEAELITEFAESPEFEALEAAGAPFRPAKTWPC
jgi:hypothetical protein